MKNKYEKILYVLFIMAVIFLTVFIAINSMPKSTIEFGFYDLSECTTINGRYYIYTTNESDEVG